MVKDSNNVNKLNPLILELANLKNIDEKNNVGQIDRLYNEIIFILENDKEAQHAVDNTNMNAISKAVELGDEKLVEILLNHGANPNSKLWGEDDHSLIQEAIDQNNLPIIKILLNQSNIKIEPPEALGLFKLGKEDPSIMQAFKKCYKLSEEDTKINLLKKAVKQNRSDLIKKWLGEDSLKDFTSNTLNEILEENKTQLEESKSYLKSKKDLDSINQVLIDIDNFVNEHKAKGAELVKLIQDRQPQKAIDLINKGGVWLNYSSSYYAGYTPLKLAIGSGQDNVAYALIKAGANVNAKDQSEYYSILLSGIDSCKKDLVNALIENGADINSLMENGYTPLMYAVISNRNLDLLDSLLKAGVDVDAKNKDGKTALMYAAERKFSDIAKSLIEAGANVNIQDKDGNTPLMHAVRCRNLDLADSLLKAGADVNAKNKDGRTVLMEATNYGELNLVNAFLEAGAEASIKNNSGKTAKDYTYSSKIRKILSEKENVEKKLDDKIDTRIENTFKEILKTHNFEETFQHNKLFKHIAHDDKHKKLFEDKAKELENNNVKMGFKDIMKSIFVGKENVKMQKVLKEIKTSLHDSEDYKILHKAKLEAQVKKSNIETKGKS